MHKRALLACLLVVTMLLSGCSLVKKDLAVDAATPILTVGEKVFTKADVQSAVNEYLQQMQQMYASYYGYNIDITDSSIISDAQSDVLDSLVRQTVIENKAAELGLDTLDEEAQAEVDETWSSYYDMIKNYLYSDSELDEEALDEAITADVYSYFGITKESLTASKVQELLKADTVKDVTVSDDQIKAEFDTRAEDAKSSYESNLSSYGSSVNGGSVVYYQPAGYRMVKQILTKFTDDDQALMDDLDDKISDLNTTISSLQSTLTSDGVEDIDALLAQVNVSLIEVVPEVEETVEDAAEEVADEATEAVEEAVEEVADAVEEAAEEVAETVEEAAEEVVETVAAAVTEAPEYVSEITDTLADDLDDTVKANVRLLKEAQEKLSLYLTQQNDAKAKAYADIDARADEVLAKIAAGEDWDALMAEYTEDPGMQSGDTSVNGYAVCENMSGFDSAFVDAAMSLENIGDTTDKIASDLYGYYIIKYVSDVEEGPVALEGEVYDTIKDDLQEQYEDETYDAAVEAWVAATKVTTDLKSLNN